ncbi:helix-turn-helix domain-containing protein [Sansalvadorimonas sp. 2012CJ34-2]|uniref:Helix-turn-helix domain-containing protein n=1 Tax=Parendozoicomonas callyspongiae TaxID=2942213 RepID=A0ABT0PKA0_9GAMM|nr:helix-turn-helix domain-containing protein [Sansalvadorimonas sp. 2012CJ34-2]MCL6271800.1 helix-turn-helix domain-containing protein [Sansalvadorimonas sp. 2012CJ34-2]
MTIYAFIIALMKTIGEHCQERRKALKLNQTAAAQAARTTRSVISAIENNRYRGALWALNNYLGILGLELTVREATRPTWDDLDALFGEDEE